MGKEEDRISVREWPSRADREDDQGRVIAHLLANPEGHEGKTYTLHGPVEMNHTEIAAVMSEVLGAKIEYAPTSIEAFKQKMEQLYKFRRS